MATTLTGTKVRRFSPAGVSDSQDETDEFPGACKRLSNLTNDPSNKNVFCASPDPLELISFSDIAGAGFVSVYKVVGIYVYGMIASSAYAGYEQPFCYSITAASETAFTTTRIPVVNDTDSAAAPAVFGSNPIFQPCMAAVGPLLYVTHPGFQWNLNKFFGWFDISSPGQPVWAAGNLMTPGMIYAVGTIVGGSGYGAGPYTNVTLTGGSGTGAKAAIFTSSGSVTRVVILNPGTSPYAVGDVLSGSFGGGSGFSVTVAGVILSTSSGVSFTLPDDIPQWCAGFYERLWLGMNYERVIPAVIFTDILLRSLTNVGQQLTFGDDIPTVAGAPMGLNNELGGVISSLMIFKGISYIIQVTGDAALNTLSVNILSVATGTNSPRSITVCPKGMMFGSREGMRIIDYSATVSDPIGLYGQGFSRWLIDSRYPLLQNVCMCANADNMIGAADRFLYDFNGAISYERSGVTFNIALNQWAGYQLTYPLYYAQPWGDSFIIQLASSGLSPLFAYKPIPSETLPNYTQTWQLQTVMIANNQDMSQTEIVELQIMTTAPNGITSMVVNILDQDANAIATSTFTFAPSTTPSTRSLYPRRINFTAPVVVTRYAVQVTGLSCPAFRIGDIYIRYRDLGYTQELPG